MNGKNQNREFQLAIIICSTLERNSIADTLNSIKNIPRNWQVILVCPNFRNNKYQEKIEYYGQSINLTLVEDTGIGIYDAMNLGLKNTKSEFILFLNDDDALIEKNIEKISVKLKNMKVNGILFLPYQEKNKSKIQLAPQANLFKTKIGRMPTSHQAQIWPKYLLVQLHGFQSKISIPGFHRMMKLKIAADFDMYLRATNLEVENEIYLEPLTIVKGGGISDRKFHRRIFETVLVLINQKKVTIFEGFWYFLKFEIGSFLRKIQHD
jgi:glycosyltransferase involved in cell wall biosynthesis